MPVGTAHTIYGVLSACKPLPVVYRVILRPAGAVWGNVLAIYHFAVGMRIGLHNKSQAPPIGGLCNRLQYWCGLAQELAEKVACSMELR